VLVSTLWLAGKEDEAVKQGYLCLALKDRIAVDKFKSSAYADLSVKSRHPLFDYKKEKQYHRFFLVGMIRSTSRVH
jgi:hypothetical protein